MSWFDKLFGEDNGSNDDLLRKNKIDVSLSNQNKIIKTHYCLKIMIFIVDQEVNLDSLYKFLKMNIRKNESYNEHSQEETNDTMSSYNQHDNLDFDSSGKRHRRRRQAYSKHNQSKITQQKQFADNNYTNNNSVFNQNDNQKSSQQRKSIQSENIKTKQTLRIRRHLLNLHI